jgi:hypothetical protein
MLTRHRTRTLHGALSGLLTLDEQVCQQLRSQIEGDVLVAYDEARTALKELETRLFSLSEGLRLCLARLEGSQSALQETVATVVGTAASWIEAMRREEVASRTLRDDIVALGLVRVQARMVAVIARELDDGQTSTELERLEGDLSRALLRLEEVLPDVVATELRAEGKVVGESGTR